MTMKRHNEIKNKITAFSKEAYRNEELLDELFRFQQEVINLTFEETYAENMNLRMDDVYKYLESKNQDLGAVADEEIDRLRKYCEDFSTMIGREVAGTNGEKKVFRALETLNTESLVLQNVELMSDSNRAEIDAVVITPKAIFLLEVKNSSHDMIIDARGNYYRARGYMNFDYNIAEKVNVKEHLLLKTIKESDLSEEIKKINLVRLVVFANSKMHCDNRFKYLRTCYLSNLPHVIDEHIGKDSYSSEDINAIAAVIEKAQQKEAYPVDFDFDGFKECFANIMVSLEKTAEIEKEISEEQVYEEIWINRENIFKKKFKYMAGAVASAAALALTGVAYKLTR